MNVLRRGAALLLILLSLQLTTHSFAAPRKARQPLRAQPHTLLQADEQRAPTPAPQLTEPTTDEPLAFVFAWQRSLARSMPGALAWAVLAAPFWLPLLSWFVIARIRRRRAAQREPGSGREPPLPRLPEQALPSLAALELTPEQTALLRAADGPSVHETFVVLGAGPESLQAWRTVVSEDLTAELWNELVGGEHGELARRLRTRWLKRLTRDRIFTWLSAQELVTAEHAEVQLPDDLEVASLTELALFGRDGLALSPDGAQADLLRETRRALTLAYRGADNPYTLQLVAEQVAMPALLVAGNAEARSTHPTALLLGGLPALERMAAAGLLPDGRGAELRGLIEEHRSKGGQALDADGPAVHALLQLPAPEPTGLGMLLASVAGAAFGPAAVSLQFSRLLGSIDQGPFEALGRLVAPALADRSSVLGQVLQRQVRQLLGDDILRGELDRARELEHTAERQAAREPLWPVKGRPPPDIALVQLHRQAVEQALGRVALAAARLSNVFAKVAYAGSGQRDQRIATSRLGYAWAGLGPRAFLGADEPTLAAAQRAIAVVYQQL